MSKVYTSVVEEDPNDPEGAILTFPEELISKMGWKEGDTLLFTDQGDGSFLLEKNTRKFSMVAEPEHIVV